MKKDILWFIITIAFLVAVLFSATFFVTKMQDKAKDELREEREEIKRETRETFFKKIQVKPMEKTKIGETIQVGNVEITPLQVKKGRVKVTKIMDSTKSYSERVLILICRVKNISEVQIFAPLNHLSYIESNLVDEHGNQIPVYLRGVEYDIAGQETKKLFPGKTREYFILAELPVVESKNFSWEIPVVIDNRFTEEKVYVEFEEKSIKNQ
jgi:hypothetical protein